MSHPGSDENTTAPAGEPARPAYPFAPAVPPQTSPSYPSAEPSYTSTPPSYASPAEPTHTPAEPTYPSTPPAYPPATYEPPTTTAPTTPAPFASPVPSAPPPASYTAGSAPVPPAGGPQSAYPYSAAPYPYTQQFSAPPVSAPYGYGMPVAPAPKRGRAGIVVLSILTALFLVTTGVFTTLFITRTSQANQLSDQVTQLSADKNSATTKANNLQRDLDAAKKDLADANSKNDETSRQRTVLADCLNAIIDENKAFNAAHGVVTADVKAKEDITNQKCDAASRLL